MLSLNPFEKGSDPFSSGSWHRLARAPRDGLRGLRPQSFRPPFASRPVRRNPVSCLSVPRLLPGEDQFAEGLVGVTVKRVLSPPWTTDWISDSGREKLREYGIAPPVGSASKRELMGRTPVQCPRCGADQTTVVSEFGSTACKASYKCDECLEPFEYFKCI